MIRLSFTDQGVRVRWAFPLLFRWLGSTVAIGLVFAILVFRFGRQAADESPVAPSAIVATADGQRFFVAAAAGRTVLVLNAHGAIQCRLAVPGAPSGLALSSDGRTLAVTCAAPASVVCLVDAASLSIRAQWSAGHTAMAPLFSPDGATLYVCERFNHAVSIWDARTGTRLAQVPVVREPVAAALTPKGERLLVANHLPHGRADQEVITAMVSVIDTTQRRVEASLALPNGSGLLLGIAVSPDGRHAAVTHNIATFQLPTYRVQRGFMNTSAVSLVSLAHLRVINSVLVDEEESGAATPWAVGWTPDGSRLLITHAGAHELSLIDFPALLARLERLPLQPVAGERSDGTLRARCAADVPADLGFLHGIRERIKLRGNGPRSLAMAGGKAWVANYFSDSIDVVNLAAPRGGTASVNLGATARMSPARRGERLFNDATLCFQQWQSCAGCHSFDARSDALNWDLLNDGRGNPKNSRSLLHAHRTPPAMSLGVRASAEVAVRAGLRFILFSAQPEEVARSIDAYLQTLEPVRSPILEEGRLSAAAQRGQRLFADPTVGCARCHAGDLFTDLQRYDVSSHSWQERPGLRFDTPTLVEVWRTAPYLHDGSALTVRDVLADHNRKDRHGRTAHLRPDQVDDLAAYVLSL